MSWTCRSDSFVRSKGVAEGQRRYSIVITEAVTDVLQYESTADGRLHHEHDFASLSPRPLHTALEAACGLHVKYDLVDLAPVVDSA